MTSKKNTVSTPDTAPIPAPTMDGATPDKQPHTSSSDTRSTVLDPSGPDPTTTPNIPSTFPINAPTPVATNTVTDPTHDPLVVFTAALQ